MIYWPFCAFIWFKNIEKMLLQMTSGFLQLESTIQLNSKKSGNVKKMTRFFSLLSWFENGF
jgi:hypothetical protein